MTFLNDDEQRGGLLPQQAPEAQAPSPTWTELFKASAESSSIGSLAESTALSWQRSLPDTNRLDDPNYDPFNDISGYEQFADAFARSGSRYETDLIKRSIDRRLQNQDTVARGGLAGLATTIATEPLMFVPMGGAASITSRIANPLLRMGAAGAITGFGGAALVEGALQATDPTRTLEQSAANIALSTGFGAGIGTVAAGLSKFLGARTGRVGTDLDSYVRAAEHAFTRSDAIAEGPSTTGAMATRATTMEQESLKSGWGADYLNKLNESEVIVGNPLARTRASDSLIVRQLSGELAETPFITKGNTVGIASPQAVETQIKRWQAPLAQALQDLDNQFTLARLGRERRFGDVARIGAQDTYKQLTRQNINDFTYSQYKQEVYMAMLNNDTHANPYVAAAAKSLRENIFDPLKERAIQNGQLPEDVTTEVALSYMMRVYDKPRIIKQRNVFEQRISDWLLNIQQEIKQQIEAGKPISDQNNIIGNIAKDAAQQAPEQPLARVEGSAPAGANMLGADSAITPTGRKVPVDYAVVDARKLITSNTDDLRPNPAYPQELQPRDRSRGATELQIKSIINPERFRPELLGKSSDASGGAPIVGPDLVVQSGNARSIALRRAYGENGATAQAYRDYLTQQGFDLTGIEQPVLVRINRSNMTPEQLQAFTREANTSSVLGMSATEKAIADAKALPDHILDLAVDGDLTKAVNRDFVRKALQSIATQNELGQLVAPDGTLSQEGLRRVQGAMIAKAYDSPEVVQNILESTETNIKAIGNALLDAAPAWNKLRAAVRDGSVPPQFDVTEPLKEAIALIDRARAEGRPVTDFVNQTDIFKGSGVTPEAETLLRWMLAGDNLKQRVGQEKLARTLNYYAQEARKVEAGPGLFGEADKTRPAQIVEAARAKGQETAIDPAAAGRSDIFSARVEKPAGASTVPTGNAAGNGDGAARAIPAPLEGKALAASIAERPQLANLAPDQQGVLAALYKQAEEAKPVFDEIATGIVKDLDAMGIKAEVKLAPLKGAARAVEKIIGEKNGKADDIKDLLRGTIIVDRLEDAAPAFETVKQRYALSGKQRFLLEEGQPSLGGYRDVFTNVNVNGHIAEMQVNVRKMYEAKEGAGHKFYEELRSYNGKADLSPEDLKNIARIETEQRAFYDAVWSEVLADAASRSEKSASEMGTPAVNALANGNGKDLAPLNATQGGLPSGSNITALPSTSKNLLTDISSPPNKKVAQNGQNVKPTAQAVKPEYVEFSRLGEEDLLSIAQEITDKIIGGAPGRSNYEPIPLTRGPLRELTLKIPTIHILDFLEKDIERVTRIYTRTMSTDVELATKFGSADMADQLVKVQDSYAVLRAAAEKELGQGPKLESRLAQLDKAMKRDIQDLEGMRDRIRGTYAIPDDPESIIVRTGRAARTLNYVRLLGGMTLSAIPDVANPIMHHGFGRVFGTLGAIKNLELYKLAANEVKLAGTALDMVLDSRAMQMADIWDDYGKHTTFERGLQAVQDRFGVVSLMAPWNATMKQFAGVMGQTRVLQEVKNWTAGSIGAREMERLAQLGIDKPMAERIAQQAEHWKADEGVIWANTGAWTDREAVDAFRNAIVKEVDAIIVTPGQDRPLWMSTEMGKMVGQFRSFAFTALSKVSVSALQRADKNVMQGIVSAVALGMMVHALKQAQYGRPMPEKPQDWIVAGLDRSGVMGWLFDANNMIEKATAGSYGINPMLGTSKTNNRFAARNVTGSLAGPSFGLLQDMIDVTAAASSGQFDRTQLEKVRRMIPYQNVPYLAWMFDQMEEGAGNAMGLPAKKN